MNGGGANARSAIAPRRTTPQTRSPGAKPEPSGASSRPPAPGRPPAAHRPGRSALRRPPPASAAHVHDDLAQRLTPVEDPQRLGALLQRQAAADQRVDAALLGEL